MNIIPFLFRANVAITVTAILLAILGSLQEAPASFSPPPPKPMKKVVKKQNPLEKKLRAIQLEKVDLRGVTLAEAVDFLRKSSVANDSATENKGVNFIVQGDLGQKLVPDIILGKVSLENALRAITIATGVSYKVEDFAVHIMKPEAVISTKK